MSMQGFRTVKGQIIVLIAICATFAPLTLSWYLTLDSLDCKNANVGSESVTVQPLRHSQKQYICYDNMQWHWVAFYGINGLIFGMPVLAVIKTADKNSIWKEGLR